MPKAYSQDLRERVIDAVEQHGMSWRAAARRFGVGESTVVKWLQHVERRGSRKPVGTGGYGGSRRRQDHLQAPVKDVPVDGFWSLTVYDSEGYF